MLTQTCFSKCAARSFLVMTLACSLLMFIFFPYATNARELTTAHELQSHTITQPYKIKLDPVIGEHPQKVLLLTSIGPDTLEHRADYRISQKKIDTFAQILESHWPITIDTEPISKQSRLLMAGYDAIIVIDLYNRDLPDNLYNNLQRANIPVTWIGFNTEQFLSHLTNEPIATEPIPEIDYIEYENVDFDPRQLILTSALPYDIEQTYVLAESFDMHGNSLPMAVRTHELFLILPFDLPNQYAIDHFSLILLDLMHETLGHHNTNRQALLRLEDVNVYTYRNINKLRRVYKLLARQQTPFHIALIARYINPEHNIDLEFGEKERFLHIIQRMVGGGLGVIVQHGYTHQYKDSISGEGFEFWDETISEPIAEDSREFVLDKVNAAKATMVKYGFPEPDIWETPHYAQSKLDNTVLNSVYPLRYEHIQGVGTLPFVAQLDETIYIPENLDFVIDTEADLAAIEHKLQLLSVFDNPVASVFWHPWRDRSELVRILDLLETYGYTVVSAYDLLEVTPANTSAILEGDGVVAGAVSLATHRNDFVAPDDFGIKEFFIYLMYVSFILGTLFYTRNILRIRKYFKHLNIKPLSTNKLKQIARSKHKRLPRIGIMVPARNEGLVIGNNIRRLASLDYPKNLYEVFIIPDERELDDDVEITTQEVTQQVGDEMNKKYGREFIHQIEVPKWFSGQFGSTEKTFERSTKGRALNYTLQVIVNHPDWKDIDFIGVVDADGRLHKDVLKEVAYKWIKYGSKLLQGPVFQVSNFKKVKLIGIVGGLELAIHHLTELPHRILHKQKMQFLAGTNYFVHLDVMTKINGWDQHALVEDAELAVRAYIRANVIADWLSQPEIEQTPANFSVYRRQRERWVRGHLMLIKDIVKSELSLYDKTRFMVKIFSAQLRFLWDISLPILAFSLLLSGELGDLNWFIGILSWYLMLVSVFIWDSYGYIYRKLHPYIDKDMTLEHKIVQSIKLIFFIPVMIVAQSVPRIHAFFNYIFNISAGWYKTERTSESILES